MENNVYIVFYEIEGALGVGGVYEEPLDAEEREDQLIDKGADETWIEAHILNKDYDA